MNRPDRPNPPARRLRAYLADAVEEIRKTSVFSSAVDWDEVEREATAVLDVADCYADTHAFLLAVLHRAGGPHSHLTPPPGSAPTRQRSPQMTAALGPPTPTGHLIDEPPAAVAYLRLPKLSEGRKNTRSYLAAGTAVMRSLIAARPAGWIVDLRANIGGGIWPMLAVAAPLLPEGVLGHFLLPDGRAEVWSAHHGRIKHDGKTMARSRTRTRTHRPGDDQSRIAVLTSRHTSSAGEAVALAFRAQPRARLIGAPTAGMSTANRTHILRDGTRLRISASVYADHNRVPVDGPVPIDEHLPDNSRDSALSAALQWIRG
ncbi:S41 family peptidase [Actinospica robiniae]|uniref:S41 family peptidase n=1 Tax=Actinospica robiniae TaxID=304901 RepID=UPI000421B727|nr:S41 family peptidase [Actinospica robiniae]